jgi:hypothetical protein
MDHLKRTGCVQNENCKPESEVQTERGQPHSCGRVGSTSMIDNSRERGGPIGSPEEDWTQGEQDLRIEPKPNS